MSARRQSSGSTGFTLIEMLIAMVGVAIVGGMAYTALTSGMLLFAKNISLNMSNADTRGALDRMVQEIQRAHAMPTLINANGSSAAGAASAAGVVFDKYLGGPYVLQHPGGTGLGTTATGFQMWRSTHPLASPPVPVNGDMILIDGSSVTPRVSAATAGSVQPDQRQLLSVSLQSPLGAPVSWLASSTQPASLLRRTAFIVASANGRNELRLYPSISPATSYDNPAQFVVITRDVGVSPGEGLPFSRTTIEGKPFIRIALRVQNRDYDKVLAGKEGNEANTYMRIDSLIRPKNNP